MVHLHCAEAPRNSSIDENHDDFGYARQSAISWRKLLLQRWAGLSHVTQSFHQLWNEHFPHHDALTLQLKQPVRSRAESYWEGESWNKAARAYHEDHKLSHRPLPSDPKTTRPTPQVTVEAILYCVRERGLKALKEPANIERLSRCDAAAKAEIERRTTKLIARKDISK